MMMPLLIMLAVLLIHWAHERNQCDDCGSQLLWCDPERSGVPVTRCFTCEGPHRAYIREGYQHLYDFEAP